MTRIVIPQYNNPSLYSNCKVLLLLRVTRDIYPKTYKKA